jgi:hypothetical protein
LYDWPKSMLGIRILADPSPVGSGSFWSDPEILKSYGSSQ